MISPRVSNFDVEQPRFGPRIPVGFPQAIIGDVKLDIIKKGSEEPFYNIAEYLNYFLSSRNSLRTV